MPCLIGTYHDVFGSYPLEASPFLKAMEEDWIWSRGEVERGLGRIEGGELSLGCNVKEENKLKTTINNKRGVCFQLFWQMLLLQFLVLPVLNNQGDCLYFSFLSFEDQVYMAIFFSIFFQCVSVSVLNWAWQHLICIMLPLCAVHSAVA